MGSQGRENMFDWLVHMPEKTWISETDVYALNTAIVYAIELFELDVPENASYVETFIEQQEVLKMKRK